MDDVKQLFAALKAKGWMLATAESCTGGMIAAALTDVAGSSAFVDRGFITYSNAAKTGMLGVPAPLIQAHGAVSAPVAGAMAAGALANSAAHIAVATTGIAGPGGGSDTKPVGLVYVAVCVRGQPPVTQKHTFSGDRASVRAHTVQAALALLLKQIV